MKQRLSVFDAETDPETADDGTYLPFVIGFYDGYSYFHFWDDPGKPGSCVPKFINFLATLDRPYLIYAHNGGKFDFMFLLEYLEQDMHIHNSRIVKAFIGKHELRDSFSIIPVALADFKGRNEKRKFASREEQTRYYQDNFSRKNRLKNKADILDYLKDDCLTLYDGVKGFREEFGDRLTIGGTSMKELQKLHPFTSGGGAYDAKFRPYYFGGRNECFAQGIIEGDYKIFDVNSMYPHVMRNFQHPISTDYEFNIKLTKKTTFAMIEARNRGCLPIRTKTGLDFTCEQGIFYACIHEINAGLETGTLDILKVKTTIEHKLTTNFAAFVDRFFQRRVTAREQGLEMLVTFYKLILNSAYGKFAQNPDNYMNYIITHGTIPEGTCPGMPLCDGNPCNHWRIDCTNGQHIIWCRPSNTKIFYNVATAASITSAARAQLLRGIAASDGPIYCDTDSIICKELDAYQDNVELGAWKLEASGDQVAIAGKKLYAVFNGENCVKKASKGAYVDAKDIKNVANGNTISVKSAVPHFKMDGSHAYVTRRLRSTAVPSKRPQGV